MSDLALGRLAVPSLRLAGRQREFAALIVAIGLVLLLPALVPSPQFEARLFSSGWGASTFVDPNVCMTPEPGEPPRLALFDKPPAVASVSDRLSLTVRYLAWGLLLPILALAATLHPHGGRRHPAFLIFGLLGIAPAYFQWPFSPVFVGLRQALGTWLVEHWPVTESMFVWIDGAALLLWLCVGALLLGGGTFAAAWAAARLVRLDWRALAHDLLPLVAMTLFLGLVQTTALYLRGEGTNLDWLPGLRAALLALAVGISGWRGLCRLVKVSRGMTPNKVMAGLLWLIPSALVALNGWLVFFHWTNRYHV